MSGVLPTPCRLACNTLGRTEDIPTFELAPPCAIMGERTMMADQEQSTAVLPAEVRPKTAPLWHVILLDDDDHTYDYVVGMLGKVFGRSPETAYRMACEVDQTGRVIVDTTSLERAELKRDQIHAYGKDWRLERSAGSMSATIEPAV